MSFSFYFFFPWTFKRQEFLFLTVWKGQVWCFSFIFYFLTNSEEINLFKGSAVYLRQLGTIGFLSNLNQTGSDNTMSWGPISTFCTLVSISSTMTLYVGSTQNKLQCSCSWRWRNLSPSPTAWLTDVFFIVFLTTMELCSTGEYPALVTQIMLVNKMNWSFGLFRGICWQVEKYTKSPGSAKFLDWKLVIVP